MFLFIICMNPIAQPYACLMHNVLLCTLGSSWAVVAEAFHFKVAGGFNEVHALTSNSPATSDGIIKLSEFFLAYPGVKLTVTRIEDFIDLQSIDEHLRFEESLYRWYNSFSGLKYVCLAGGFKSMSAAMQKAAYLFGAEQVFHVLAVPLPDSSGRRHDPQTTAEVLTAVETNGISYIPFGKESGLPMITALPKIPQEVVTSESYISLIRCSEYIYTESVRSTLLEMANVTKNIYGDYPFSCLAKLADSEIAWLTAPLEADDFDWVRSLPKIELHCHLGGFATHAKLLSQVAAAGQMELVPVPFPEPWPIPNVPVGLQIYRDLGNATGSNLLTNIDCLREHCKLLYTSLCDDNVIYAEIRCSPANYASEEHSPWEIMCLIRAVFNDLMVAGSCKVNLIVIVTRQHAGDLSDISRHIALAITAAEHWSSGCRVVGVDLAGYECVETRAAFFANDFTAVHRVGLAVTAHAGENDDAEGIWQAVFKLSARRLGHALHLSEHKDLLRSVSARKIGIEMCPYANVQINGFRLYNPTGFLDYPNYPLLEYLNAGIQVTINTDNIGISAATLSDNLMLLRRLCFGISRMQILQLQRNALNQVFAVDTSDLESKFYAFSYITNK